MEVDKLYIYEMFDCDGWDSVKGVVFADTEDEAVGKVRKAYGKHYGNDFNADNSYITVIKATESNGNWFADSPDVVEVSGAF